MNNNFLKKIVNFAFSNQSIVAGSALFIFAFIIFFVNTVFNQPERHPSPFWGIAEKANTQKITPLKKNNSYKSPVRKEIPVPATYPFKRVAQEQNQALQAVSPGNKVSGSSGQASVKDGDALKSIPQPVPASSKIKNKDIAEAQRLLSYLDLYSGAVDGVAGPQTKQAVKQFERRKNLPDHGNITPSLLESLRKIIETRHDKKSGQLPKREQPVSRQKLQAIKNRISNPDLIKKGNILPGNINTFSNNRVKMDDLDPATITRIQIGLINFGNHDVPINGKMNPQTKLAIRRFQKKFIPEKTSLSGKELIKKLENIGALVKR